MEFTSVIDVKRAYQNFKKTDEYSELLEESIKMRPDLKDKINFIEMTIYKWFVKEKLNLDLSPTSREYEPIKKFNVVEGISVSKSIEEWESKYPLKEINKDSFKELGSVSTFGTQLDYNNLDIKKVFNDTPDNEILYHNRLIKSTDDLR